jgi:tRNA pseudouridine55 synthase
VNPGVHLLHKPVGPTSFSLVRACMERVAARGQRRLRVCHGGALDPFASGLLLILVEPATKLFDHLHGVPKVYEATVRWGAETDNGDPLGQVVATGDASSLTPARLDEALASFVGWHEQVPPATSNKRVDGERAYAKAHRGEPVELPPSRVYLHEAAWLSHDLPRASRLRIVVRGGYYVRSLARDLGRGLGCFAHLDALHRAAIGPWLDPGPERSVELRGRDILPWTPTRVLSDQDVGDLRQDKTIAEGELHPPDWNAPAGFPQAADTPIRGFHRGRLSFLLSREGGRLRVRSPLRGGL